MRLNDGLKRSPEEKIQLMAIILSEDTGEFKQKPVRASRKTPCLVCGAKGWPCSFSADRELAWCGHFASDKPSINGTWLHILIARVARPQPAPRRVVEVEPRVELAPVEHRDGVFCTLLRRELSLCPAHMGKLLARGFMLEEVERLGYASTPSPECGDKIAQTLSIYGLEGVPGFFENGGRWRMVRRPPGFFIPYRDEHGRICGLQSRVDEPRGGAKYRGAKYLWFSSQSAPSGTPVHYARHHLLHDTDELLITEGALKADLSAFLLNRPVAAGAGVNCFKGFAAELRETWPHGRTALLAFDADLFVNAHVRRALETLARDLERARFRVRVRTWPANMGKGLDDYLLTVLAESSKRVGVAA
jgi:hypothetical protein